MTVRKEDSIGFGFLSLPECSLLTEKGGCELMGLKRCTGKECKFAKTIGTQKVSEDLWRKRMLSLSEEEQNKISRKYYGGSRPWE